MRVVHVRPRIEAPRQWNEFVERKQIAVHREDPFHHDQRTTELVAVGLEHGRQRADVGMWKHTDRGLRQSAAIDQRRMTQRVGIDHIAGADERRNGTDVRHIPRRKEQRLLAALEARQGLLEHLVYRVVARDESRRAGTYTFGLQNGTRSTGQPCIGREAEIVVRREVGDAFAIEQHGAGSALMHLPQRAAQPGALQRHKLLLQNVIQAAPLGGVHARCGVDYEAAHWMMNVRCLLVGCAEQAPPNVPGGTVYSVCSPAGMLNIASRCLIVSSLTTRMVRRAPPPRTYTVSPRGAVRP